MPKKPPRRLESLTVYRSGREWRWTLRAANGLVIGASSEGYSSRSRCIGNFHHVTQRTRLQMIPNRGSFRIEVL